MLVEQQIAERRGRAPAALVRVVAKPANSLYGDYRVESVSGRTYRVAMRGPSLFENYCSCPDFAVNTLGTCKHIEALLQQFRKRCGQALKRKRLQRTRASVSLFYGETIEVRLHLPASPSPELHDLAAKHFDLSGFLRPERRRQFAQVLEELRSADDQAVIYSDVLEYIDRQNELAEGLETERKLLTKFQRGQDPLAGVLKTKLLPYQVRGALFAACRGRVALADDMGLGKTVQALAAAELLRRRRGIERVLVIAPASVKYQWKTEIERFTNLSVQVIDGYFPRRRELYGSPRFFNLTSYELMRRDLPLVQDMKPDLIILDEAQRIRNWTTATARQVKQLKSRYAFVLTGTPLENKLEELFSVVEFVDGRLLGPAFRFLQDHRMEDDKGYLIGYRGLDRLHEKLQPILLRRTRQEVLKDLPQRTDQVYQVRMTEEQSVPYWEQSEILGKLMHKWQRQGWLSEIDLRRITCCIQNMRMLCNSTFLFDKKTNHSPKLEEFREIIRELAIEEQRKVVVFSEYERMTYLVGEELDKLGISFVSLHGGVPARKRGDLIEKFRRDPECRVFLSTDAGGVGLNLQAASTVVNLEPPWNPARLEQRIGRVHRLGQSHPVQVIHLLTTNSIEERVWETLRLKKSLFAGVFDSPTAEVSFAALRRKSVLQAVKEMFADQGATKVAPGQLPSSAVSVETKAPAPATGSPSAPRVAVGEAAAGLIEAGLKFLESLAPAVTAEPAQESAIGRALSGVFSRDRRTNQPVLSIPLPASVTEGRLAKAITGLLTSLARQG
jgi:superfamily II DNA or RNA helicase